MTSHQVLTAREFGAALEAAGVISDLNSIQRIVIDADPAKMVEIHVQREGDQRLLGIVPMLTDAQVVEQPKAVRYWVQVADDLVNSETAAWPSSLRPVRPDQSAPPPDAFTRWWLFEDDDAPAELDGKKVELTFTRFGHEPARVTERRVVS